MKKIGLLILVLVFVMASTSPAFAAAKELDFSPPGQNVGVTNPDNMFPGSEWDGKNFPGADWAFLQAKKAFGEEKFPGSEWDDKNFPGSEWFPGADWDGGDQVEDDPLLKK
ncbi:hypothetical protein [Halobacillus seohaensis]|uniref:Uncharacterized protein n=1 Tax=Halobacillus seohaensis TaxID=447421 RepID=A0ABW2ETR8_9BACI